MAEGVVKQQLSALDINRSRVGEDDRNIVGSACAGFAEDAVVHHKTIIAIFLVDALVGQDVESGPGLVVNPPQVLPVIIVGYS